MECEEMFYYAVAIYAGGDYITVRRAKTVTLPGQAAYEKLSAGEHALLRRSRGKN